MLKTKTAEPMTKTSYVHTTTDYFLFKPIDGNRNKNLLHINRLKQSMEDNYLFTVIIVNENYEIIDGQHRFDVIQELQLPLNYIVCEGYGLNEVHILNQNSKTWNADDYLAGYCNLGYSNYIAYKEFKDTYGIRHREAMGILAEADIKSKSEAFFKGEFKIKNLDEACAFMDKICLIEPYYEGFKRSTFIYAMMSLFKNPKFEYTEFLQKLKQQPTAMVDCTTNAQYIALIEEIYNYRRHTKISLRYK